MYVVVVVPIAICQAGDGAQAAQATRQPAPPFVAMVGMYIDA